MKAPRALVLVGAAPAAAGVGGDRRALEGALTMAGWPFVVAMPIVTLGEGIGVSITRSLWSGATAGVALGLMGLACVLAFVAVWVRVLAVTIPRRRLRLVPNATVEGAGTSSTTAAQHGAMMGGGYGGAHRAHAASRRRTVCGRALACLSASVEPSQLWAPVPDVEAEADEEGQWGGLADAAPTDDSRRSGEFEMGLLVDDAGGGGSSPLSVRGPSPVGAIKRHGAGGGPRITEATLERYGNALGDKRLYYAEFVSFLCSLVVGVMEGVPPAYCGPRAVVALLATVLQCLCSCSTLVPLELVLQVLSSVCVVPMAVMVVVAVFTEDGGGDDDGDGGGGALSGLQGGVAVLVMLANMLGLALLGLSLVVSGRAVLMQRRGQQNRDEAVAEHVDDDPLPSELNSPSTSLSDLLGVGVVDEVPPEVAAAGGAAAQELELALADPVSGITKSPLPDDALPIMAHRLGLAPPKGPRWQVAYLDEIDAAVDAEVARRKSQAVASA